METLIVASPVWLLLLIEVLNFKLLFHYRWLLIKVLPLPLLRRLMQVTSLIMFSLWLH